MSEDFGNVLFVHNKYYQGLKERGPTSTWEVNWGLSIKSFFGNQVSTFNPDSFGPESSHESDLRLLQLIEQIKPRFLIMIYNNYPHPWTRDFISLQTLGTIKMNGIEIISIWGDINLPGQRALLRRLAPYISLNLCSGSEAIVARLGMPQKVQYIWVPIVEMQSIPNGDCSCGNMVSFAGKRKDKRAKTITYLKKKKIGLHDGGGEGVGTLSRSEYLNLIGHPMTINFAGTSPIFESFVLARAFEAISQKSLLLEQWGTETCKLLEPNIEYVPWFSKRDLCRKIKYYQNNPDKLLKISEKGHLKFNELSNSNLWEMVMNRFASINGSSRQATFSMKLENLPLTYRYISILLDSMSRYPRFEIFFEFRLKVIGKRQAIVHKWLAKIDGAT